MMNFKFAQGLLLGLLLGVILSLYTTYAQSIQTVGPSGLYIEQIPPNPGAPMGKIRYSLFFETIEIQHHGETLDVDVHKLMNLLRTIK